MTTRLDVIAMPSADEFVDRYIARNQPVVVRGLDYRAEAFTPEGLRGALGDLTALVYGALFDLDDIQTLADYLDDWFGDDVELPGPGEAVPYVRWYNQLRDVAFNWGDEAFARLAPSWVAPTCLPTDYVVPVTAAGAGSNPVIDPFPYRGILVAAAGARTRLHRDPFGTDAVVCMFHGRKEAILYRPERAAELAITDDTSSFGGFMDVRPDGGMNCSVEPDCRGILEPGDMIFIPHGWLHDVVVLDDSVSVTWNFVHAAGADALTNYLAAEPERDSEFEILQYFHRKCGITDVGPSDMARGLVLRRSGEGHRQL